MSSLRRQSKNAEAIGDAPAALACWQTLAELASPGTPEWFETRYHTIRLMAAIDPGRAAASLAQIKVIYPELGPEPWRTRLRELERKLPSAAPAPTAPPAVAPPAPQNAPDGGPR